MKKLKKLCIPTQRNRHIIQSKPAKNRLLPMEVMLRPGCCFFVCLCLCVCAFYISLALRHLCVLCYLFTFFTVYLMHFFCFCLCSCVNCISFLDQGSATILKWIRTCKRSRTSVHAGCPLPITTRPLQTTNSHTMTSIQHPKPPPPPPPPPPPLASTRQQQQQQQHPAPPHLQPKRPKNRPPTVARFVIDELRGDAGFVSEDIWRDVLGFANKPAFVGERTIDDIDLNGALLSHTPPPQ